MADRHERFGRGLTGTQPLPVLVVGAGPTGLLLALTLLQNGVRVRVIDKDPNRQPGFRSSGLQPRTQEIFRFLGILDDMLREALSVKLRCEYKLPGGTEPTKIVPISPEAEVTPSTPYVRVKVLGQYNTEAILREHIERLGGTVEFGTELRSFEQQQDRVDAVLVTQSEGTEQTESVACHWLVGADGPEGVVRQHLGLTFLGSTLEEAQMMIGLVEVSGLSTEYWHHWGDVPSGMVLILFPTEKPSYFGFILTGDRYDLQGMHTDEQEVRRIMCACTGRQDLLFGTMEAVTWWRPSIRMVVRFGDRRVFVAGDAAHVHSPNGAQGMVSGFLDSFNLAWKLTLVEKGLASPSLLSTYTEERLPVIAEMLQKSTLLYDAMQRDEEAAWTRPRDLWQLGVNYRWSSIVVDERTPKPRGPMEVNPYGSGTDGTLRAGDRAPDAPGLVPVSDDDGAPAALFDVFRPIHHTMLLFNLPTQELARMLTAAKMYPSKCIKTVVIYPRGTSKAVVTGKPDLAFIDRDGHAFKSYQVPQDRPTIVIVRPDAYVGAIAHGLQGFASYFRRIFIGMGDTMR